MKSTNSGKCQIFVGFSSRSINILLDCRNDSFKSLVLKPMILFTQRQSSALIRVQCCFNVINLGVPANFLRLSFSTLLLYLLKCVSIQLEITIIVLLF